MQKITFKTIYLFPILLPLKLLSLNIMPKNFHFFLKTISRFFFRSQFSGIFPLKVSARKTLLNSSHNCLVEILYLNGIIVFYHSAVVICLLAKNWSLVQDEDEMR